MKDKLRKYLRVGKTSFQNNLAYTGNFVFSIIFYAFILFVFLQLWRTIYDGGNTIAGYSLNQMIWYCVITEMVMLSGSNLFQELNSDIKGGGIAYLLNKPYDYILYQLSNSMGLTAVKLAVNLVVGILLGLIYVGPLAAWHVKYLPFVLLAGVLGILLNFFIIACIGLSAFWAEDNMAFFWIYQKLVFMLGLYMPVEFLPGWMQKITLLLPFSYVTYGPARLVVNFSMDKFTAIVLTQAAYLILFVLLSFAIYRKGVRVLNVNGG